MFELKNDQQKNSRDLDDAPRRVASLHLPTPPLSSSMPALPSSPLISLLQAASTIECCSATSAAPPSRTLIISLFTACPFSTSATSTQLLLSESRGIRGDLTLPSTLSHLDCVVTDLFRDHECWPLASSRFLLALLRCSQHVYTCFCASYCTSQ